MCDKSICRKGGSVFYILNLFLVSHTPDASHVVTHPHQLLHQLGFVPIAPLHHRNTLYPVDALSTDT